MNDLFTSEIILIAAILLILIKTVHYFKTIRHRRLINWFYFGIYSIAGSHNPRSIKAKKIQNTLTLTLVFILAIAVVWLLLTGK